MNLTIRVLAFFGIKEICRNQYFMLCKNSEHAPTQYFKSFEKGRVKFTSYRDLAWKFTSSDEAKHAQRLMGIKECDIYVKGVYNVLQAI